MREIQDYKLFTRTCKIMSIQFTKTTITYQYIVKRSYLAAIAIIFNSQYENSTKNKTLVISCGRPTCLTSKDIGVAASTITGSFPSPKMNLCPRGSNKVLSIIPSLASASGDL